ncbi:MAG: SDR family NAD(P)-dependent oxidoreductase [Pseudomonadota bacterium]
MIDLSDHVVLVTGASRGFGHASARALAARGAHVIAVARTVGGLEALDDAIKAAGGTTPVLVPLDLTDDGGVMRMGAALYERFGRVDLWLHTAAHAPFLSRVVQATEKDLDATLALNIRAFQRLVRATDPLLRLAPGRRGLALIATEDRAGQPFWGLYAAARAAQSALTQAWAREAQADFTVAEVVPPEMATALRSRFYPNPDRQSLTTIEDAAGALVAALAERPAPGARLVLPARPTGTG